jgi:hypothetical protein
LDLLRSLDVSTWNNLPLFSTIAAAGALLVLTSPSSYEAPIGRPWERSWYVL